MSEELKTYYFVRVEFFGGSTDINSGSIKLETCL